MTVIVSHTKNMYIVADENTFGYTIGSVVNGCVRMVVMSVDVPNGGDPLMINRTMLAVNFRQATKEDGDRFGVRLKESR